jgi:hypothetical protein
MVSPTRKNMQFIDSLPTKPFHFDKSPDSPTKQDLQFDASNQVLKAFDGDQAGRKEEDPADPDFFQVKQYVKKRSLSNGDAFNVKEEPSRQPPMSTGSLENRVKKVVNDGSEPKTSETKSNTDSNPTSTQMIKPLKMEDPVLKVTKKQS